MIYNPQQHGASSIRIPLGEVQVPVLSPGAKLGPYKIMSSIGAGGMGEVYRAHDTRLDRTVAIKILPAQVSSDPVRKQRSEGSIIVRDVKPLFRSPFVASVVRVIFDVEPSGQKFLGNAAPDTSSLPLNVVTDWPSLLKK